MQYQSIDPHGDTVLCSGAIYVPNNAYCDYPVMNFNHGTVLKQKSFHPIEIGCGWCVSSVDRIYRFNARFYGLAMVIGRTIICTQSLKHALLLIWCLHCRPFYQSMDIAGISNCFYQDTLKEDM